MSDQIEKPTWQDEAPEEQHGVLTDPSQLSGDNWVPSSDTVTQQALQIDGASNVASAYDSGKSVVESAQAVDGLTDWEGMFDLAGTFGDAVTNISDQVQGICDFAKVLAENPLGWLAGTITEFLLGIFQPLDDLVKLVSGNDALITNSAEMWGAVADGCPQVSTFFSDTADAALQGWEGDASNAARMRVSEVGFGIEIMGFLAVGMKHLLTKAAELATAAYEKVKGYIAEGVEWVLTRIVAYLAASWATLGAAVPVAVADTVRKVCTLLLNAYNWIKQAIEVFVSMVKASQIVQTVVTKVKPVLDFLQKAQPYVEGAQQAYAGYQFAKEFAADPTGTAQQTAQDQVTQRYGDLAGDMLGQVFK
jgi:hypothetical protein